VREGGETEGLQRLLGVFQRFRLGSPEVQGAERHILNHLREEKLILGVLKHVPHGAAEAPEFRFGLHRLPLKTDVPGLRREEPRDELQERRLPAAVRSIETDFFGVRE